MAKIQDFVERVMAEHYTREVDDLTGEVELIEDIQELVNEGYIVREGETPYGALEEELTRLKESFQMLDDHLHEVETENEHLLALNHKFGS